MPSLQVTHPLHRIFRILASHVSGYSHCTDAWGIRKEQTPFHDDLGLYSERRRDYLQDIDNKIRKYRIPPELVLNSDQTPSSYVSVGKSNMARKGSTSIPSNVSQIHANVQLL